MKEQNKLIKTSFFKKILIKICRILGYEIIDQSSFYVPTQKKSLNENLNINPKTFLMEAVDPKIKDELKKRTDDAYKKGIFGTPSFIVNNKMFWGQDRLEFVLKEAKK